MFKLKKEALAHFLAGASFLLLIKELNLGHICPLNPSFSKTGSLIE